MNCSTPGCETKARTKGLCHKCYNRKWHADKRAAELAARGPLCSTPKCKAVVWCKGQCRPCYQRAWYLAHKDLYRKSNRKRLGIQDATGEQFEGPCEICGVSGKLCCDHDHKTGVIRGLLCNACNLGLGKFKDSKDILTNAIKYLDKCLPNDDTGDTRTHLVMGPSPGASPLRSASGPGRAEASPQEGRGDPHDQQA